MALPTTIQLTGGAKGTPFVRERLSAAAGILPGMLVLVDSTGKYAVHATAAGAAETTFALENVAAADGIGVAYLSGVTCRGGTFMRGQEVYAYLPASAGAVVIGDMLESSGDGTLRKLTGSVPLAVAVDAVDNSGGGAVARIKARIL